MNERPVHLIVRDDELRSPLTVFYRLLLVLPHLFWLFLWGLAVFVAAIVNWFATLIAGQSPKDLHNFLAAYVRYMIHVGAYLFLVAEPFPDFSGMPGYPVEVEIAPPRRQNRWTVLFRLILAVPALLLIGVLASGNSSPAGSNLNLGAGLLGTVAFLGWFACLGRGRMPRGLRDAAAYALAYSAQFYAYLLLLTDRYPNSDPLAALDDLPLRSDPIDLEAGDDLSRSRLTVFFRLLLTLPHLLWLTLWGIVAILAAIVNWLATLIGGRSPEGLHRFLSAYVRYGTHVGAYLFLTANPFPGFTGKEGSYPVEVSIDGPREQNRWVVGFRIVAVVPALMAAGAYFNIAVIAAILGWFAALVTGTMPRGLRSAQALALRYLAQTSGYLLLLTQAYPYTGPSRSPVPAANFPKAAPPVPMPA